MKNLFIMHTQYNLILACGIAKSRYKYDINELVLYAEFTLGEDLRKSLESAFDKVYYIQEKFTDYNRIKDMYIYLHKCLKKSKSFLNNNYDNVFLSQERPYDTYVLTRLSKHCDFKCFAIEEDVYFPVKAMQSNNIQNQPKKKSLISKAKIANSLRTVLFGKNKYEASILFYGMNPNYDANFVLFPNAVRKQLERRTLFEVTKEELFKGINSLYGDKEIELPKSKKNILFYFDLLERYKNKEEIQKLVEYIYELCVQNGMTMICKYHPRETQKFDISADNDHYFEIPNIIPSEKISALLKDNEVAVIGNLTTALWVSAKMGMTVFSVIKIENPSHTSAAEALNKMNIGTPVGFIELKNNLRSWIES